MAFQELGTRGTEQCLETGIPTLSSSRALIVPGFSWPA